MPGAEQPLVDEARRPPKVGSAPAAPATARTAGRPTVPASARRSPAVQPSSRLAVCSRRRASASAAAARGTRSTRRRRRHSHWPVQCARRGPCTKRGCGSCRAACCSRCGVASTTQTSGTPAAARPCDEWPAPQPAARVPRARRIAPSRMRSKPVLFGARDALRVAAVRQFVELAPQVLRQRNAQRRSRRPCDAAQHELAQPLPEIARAPPAQEVRPGIRQAEFAPRENGVAQRRCPPGKRIHGAITTLRGGAADRAFAHPRRTAADAHAKVVANAVR